MTLADIILIIGMIFGFGVGIPVGVWLSEFAKKRNWK